MSTLPEPVLQTMLVRGFQKFSQDKRFIRQLFRNLDQKQLPLIEQLLSYGINIEVGYPRSTLKLPSIIILLRNETESAGFLADHLDIDYPDAMSYDGAILGSDIVLGNGPSPKQGASDVFGPYRATSATKTTLTINKGEWATGAYEDGTYYIVINSGLGVGQTKKILSNTKRVLTLDGEWKQTPDSTSIFTIKQYLLDKVGEPVSLYNKRNKYDFLEHRGSMYGMSYLFQIIGQSSEVTLALTSLVKSIVYLSRVFLETNGIKNLKMSATDFVKMESYQPDNSYSRSLNVDFIYETKIYEFMDDLAKEFNTFLLDSDGEELITSSFTIDETITIEG